MSLSVSEGARDRTTGIIVGVIVAIIPVFFVLDVAIVWKLLLVGILVVVALLNFLVISGSYQRIRWKMGERRREGRISERKDLIDELYRLNNSFHKVISEKTQGEPSLKMNATSAMTSISEGVTNGSLLLEDFSEKVAMADAQFNQFYQRIANRAMHRKWKTMEFVELLREISDYLLNLNGVFQSVYRGAALWAKQKPLPTQTVKQWEAFSTRYNHVLQEWRTFTERFGMSIGLSAPTRASDAKPIP